MKTKLTLQEKLRDLRDERKMTLSDLTGATGIPLSILQSMEGKDDIRTGYQDVAALAGVDKTADQFLRCGFTSTILPDNPIDCTFWHY